MDPAKWSAAVGIIPACCTAVVVSYWLGRVKAPGVQWAIVLGGSVGLICAGGYFMFALMIETLWAGCLDARCVGIGFAIVCVAAPLGGALAALRGYSL